MSSIIFYIAILLFIGSCIGFYFFISKAIKDKLRITKEELFKKNIPFLGLFSIIFTLSLVLFTISFYLNETTIWYLSNKGITLNGGRLFLAYFFVILLGFAVSIFTVSFCYYYFLDNFDTKIRKIFKISMYSSIPAIFLFFILMSEGNAPYLQYPLCNSLYIGKHGIAFINSYTHPAPYYNGYSLDGGISIAFYAIFILSGALLVFGLCDHLIYKFYGKHGLVSTCFFIAFPSGIIGARLWYVLLDISDRGTSSQFIQNPISILYFNQGGLGIMGGAILGIIAGVSVMLYFKYFKKDLNYQNVSYLRLVDIIVPTILIAQAIGRFGNFFNCEVHGNEIPFASIEFLPSFLKYNYQYNYTHFINDPTKAYLPLSIIETITNLIGYFVIYYGFSRGLRQYHAEGSCCGLYFIWYGTTRALLEPLRYGEFEYQMSVISSYFMIGGGILIVAFFVVWKYLRTHHLWVYKTREVKDAIIINDELDKKAIIRNAIILVSVLVVIAVIITILFNIW